MGPLDEATDHPMGMRGIDQRRHGRIAQTQAETKLDELLTE
jgi:hypothetical protein